MSGFIKLARKAFRHMFWEERRTFSRFEAWLDLLQMAAFTPTKRTVRGKLIELSEGELVASERYLETRWGWSRSRVRTFVRVMKNDEMLNQRKDQGETILTICNYVSYNGGHTSEKTTKRTSEEPANSHDCDHNLAQQIATSSDCKRVSYDDERPSDDTTKGPVTIPRKNQSIRTKEGKEGEDLLSGHSVDRTAPSAGMWELVWSNVPQISRTRSSRPKTEAAWLKLKTADRPTREQLETALQAWNASEQWRDGYACGCHRWITNQQWLNLPEPTSRPATNPREYEEPETKLKILG